MREKQTIPHDQFAAVSMEKRSLFRDSTERRSLSCRRGLVACSPECCYSEQACLQTDNFQARNYRRCLHGRSLTRIPTRWMWQSRKMSGSHLAIPDRLRFHAGRSLGTTCLSNGNTCLACVSTRRTVGAFVVHVFWMRFQWLFCCGNHKISYCHYECSLEEPLCYNRTHSRTRIAASHASSQQCPVVQLPEPRLTSHIRHLFSPRYVSLQAPVA